MRRLDQQRHIHSTTAEQLAVRVQAREAMAVIDNHLFAEVLLQRIAGELRAVRKGVGHGGQLCGRIDGQRARGGPAAAAAAADQTNPQPIAAGGMDTPRDSQAGGHGCSSEDSRLGQEVATRG